MKIGLIRQRYVASGGAERYLQALVGALSDRGYQVGIFAWGWEGALPAGVTWHRVPVVPAPSFARALSFAWAVRRRVAGAGCHCVFSLERTVQQDVYRAGDGCHREWLAQLRRFRSPWGRCAVALNPVHPALLALERRTFSPERTRIIIANSFRGRDEIVRHYGYPAERIRVIYNGVDLQRFPSFERPLRRGGGEVGLLFVGSGWERKGLRFGLEALARLPQSVVLRVVGKGDVARYERLAARLGLGRRVRFLGTRADVRAAYREADLLVHPAIYEPFANVCLEGLACGLPVVTTRANGASEILRPGFDGAIVEDPSDSAALADAIRSFLDPNRLAAAAAEARKTAEAHPFDRNVAATLEVLLESVPAPASG